MSPCKSDLRRGAAYRAGSSETASGVCYERSTGFTNPFW